MKRIRILIIDDSATARAALRAALADDPALEVVGEASDGAEARANIEQLKPDLITMDVFLRAENGLDLTASVMKSTPLPILVVTAADTKDATLVFRAMQAGALEVCAKLPSPSHPDYAARRARLVRAIKVLHAVPVIKRRRSRAPRRQNSRALGRRQLSVPLATDAPARPMLLIGASTGGPPVLAKLLRDLPRPFPIPIVLVQHMLAGFVAGFAKWLADDTGHRVSLITHSCAADNGVVYVTDLEHHLVVDRRARVGVSSEEPRSYHRPSVDVLFESVAATSCAAQSIAVLLTGMGNDGAHGLLKLRNAGAHTIAQDPLTCTVSSMPARAIELNAALEVLAPEAMPATIKDLLAKLGLPAGAR